MLKNEKGVLFNLTSEADAITYFQERNNYLRTASYRKNYPKHIAGANIGKYINLEFAYLTELSTIDMYLRTHLLQMCIDIEHALKVRLVKLVEENSAENGYSLVKDFLNKYPNVKNSIELKANAVFTGDLIAKYFCLKNISTDHKYVKYEIVEIDCPVWVFVEIISFGDLIKLFNLYCDKYPKQYSRLPKNIINPIRSLRNACAHNNCLLCAMSPQQGTRPPQEISLYVAGFSDVGREERKKKLTSRPLFEITCLLYYYNSIVSEKVKEKCLEELKDFVGNRMIKHIAYFEKNKQISTSILFIKKLVDNIA